MTDWKEDHWKQTGRLVMWEYDQASKGYRGMHLTCDREGCRSVISLLEQLLDSSRPRSRTLAVSKPTENELKILNYSGGTFWSPSRVRLVGHLEEEKQNMFELERDDDKIVILLGRKKLKELINCFQRLLNGDMDFSLLGDTKKVRLNFW